jgi:hypothetical protein
LSFTVARPGISLAGILDCCQCNRRNGGSNGTARQISRWLDRGGDGYLQVIFILSFWCGVPASAQTASARLTISNVHLYAGTTELEVTGGGWHIANRGTGLDRSDHNAFPVTYPAHLASTRPGETLLSHIENPQGDGVVASTLDRGLSESEGLWSIAQNGARATLPANTWITISATVSYALDNGGDASGLASLVGFHAEAYYNEALFTRDWSRMQPGEDTFEWRGTLYNTDAPTVGWHLWTEAVVGNVGVVPEPAPVAMLLAGLSLLPLAARRRGTPGASAAPG